MTLPSDRASTTAADAVRIRPAAEADLPELTRIYNHYIRTTAITFDIEPYTVERRRPWFDGFGRTGRHRLLVATDGPTPIGYASSGPFRTKAAYAPSVEVSVYCAAEARGRGVGARLYAALFDALADADVHRAYAGVALPNDASLALHHRFGFTEIGTFREVGRKFGRYWDVRWFEKDLG